MGRAVFLKKNYFQWFKKAVRSWLEGPKEVPVPTKAIRNGPKLKSPCTNPQATVPDLFSVIENTSDIIWSIDSKFRFLMCNPAFKQLVQSQTGQDRAPAPGDPVGLDYFPEQSAGNWLDFYNMALQGKRFTIETGLIRNGQLKTFELSFSPVFNEGAKVIGTTVIGRDISLRKTSEKELNLAKDKAEEVSLAKAEFLSTMSHEIRTPLNAVIGITHLLLRQSPRENQIEYLNTLKFSSENLMALVNDILDYNKIVEGELLLEKINFDLSGLMMDIKQSFILKAAQKNINFSVSVDTSIPSSLIGDKTRIAQILNNLIGNAIKFTEKGEVRIKVTLNQDLTNEVTIDFLIYDTGIGIPEDKIEIIFNRFAQVGPEISRKFGGTGLGLAITKKLLELQGAAIKVESKVGKGSRFSFSLQLRKGAKGIGHKTVSGTPKITLSRNLQGLRVLLVEDNQVNQLVAAEFLRKWNAKLMVADSGKKAIGLVKKNDFDLILMDLQMPGMDGYETCMAIKQISGRTKDIPVMALTANTLQEIREEVYKAGMSDIVTKPFDPDELFTKLCKYSDRQHKNTKKGELGQKIINVAKLDEIAEGNEQFLKAIVASYIEELAQFKTRYPEIIHKKDLSTYKAAKHKISPSLKLFGAGLLENLIATGESYVRSKDHPVNDNKGHVQAVQEQIEKMILILRYQQTVN